ncbi:hypothetical protein IGI04_015074, partial [Brassica rapa subsp. trilocularis]
MTTGGTNPDTSGEEPALTPPPPPPLLSSEFMSSVIARLAHQEEVQKTTNDQLAAIVAALSASTGNSQPLRRYLFNTNPPTPAEGRTTNPVDPTLQLAETLAADASPTASDPSTIREIAELKLNFQQMTHVEPRQHAPSDKNNRKNGLLYVVDENGKKWNTFHRETDPPSESPRATAPATVAQVDSAAGSSRTPPGLTKSCKLHGVKGHDTSECKTLFAQFLSSLESGEIKIPPPKPKSENSWSRNKDRKNQRKNQAKPRQDDQKPKVAEQIPHRDDDGDASADEDPPAARQRIEVIRAQPESSSDEESDFEEALDPLDLRVLLKRKTTSTNDKTLGSSDLRVELNAKRTKHSLSPGSSLATTEGNPIVDLRDQLNARVSDLRAKLDHKKA